MSSGFKSVKAMFALDGKKTIVTGSGSGMGSAIAHGLAEFGIDVALIGRTVEKLKKVEREIEQRIGKR